MTNFFDEEEGKKKIYFNPESISEQFYIKELNNIQSQDLTWYSQEFNLQLNRIIHEWHTKSKSRLYELSQKLLPYFYQAQFSKLDQVQNMAKEGLQEIQKTYPEMYTSFMKKKKKRNTFLNTGNSFYKFEE